MVKFSASRETVRKALERPVLKSLIVRRPGLGTFVSSGTDNHLVGILVQQITSYIFPYVVLGAEEYLFRNEYKMLLGNSSEDPVKERQILTEWMESGVKGFIIDPVYSATKRSSKDLVKSLANTGVKIVLVHSDWDLDQVSSVVLDDAYGGEQAAEVLFKHGHRNAAVMYKSTHLPGVIRARGFLDRCKQLGFDKVYEKAFNVSEFTGAPMQIAHELLALPGKLRPTSVFCYNDATALQLHLVAKRLSLRIPDDLSVVGFDDGPIGDFRDILTTFAHPKEDVGRKAVEILLDMLDGAKPQKLILKPELIERSSVAQAE